MNSTPVAALRKSGATTAIHYVWADHLDTPRAVTTSDAAAAVEWRWDSDPFGTSAPQEITLAYNLRFPGQYYDQETGLHYNYFRDYDPGIGRYLQSDPIGLRGGLNTYGYVGANPFSFIDPFGLAEICRKIFGDEWRPFGRDWKLVDYESSGPLSNLLGGLLDALSSIRPGGFSFDMRPRVSIYKDIILEQQFKLLIEVCFDECSGTETSRRTVRADSTQNFRENEVVSSGVRRGGPLLVSNPFDKPSMNSRWGLRRR